jgi:hypothetical protein
VWVIGLTSVQGLTPLTVIVDVVVRLEYGRAVLFRRPSADRTPGIRRDARAMSVSP